MIACVVTGRIPRAITRRDMNRAIQLTIRATRRKKKGTVVVAFVSNQRIQELNRRYRRCDHPTDVLSFSPLPAFSVFNGRGGTAREVGDLFLSPSYIRKAARERGIPFREECLRVSIHGLLHLFGYDHAIHKEEKRMFGIQERVVRRLESRI